MNHESEAESCKLIGFLKESVFRVKTIVRYYIQTMCSEFVVTSGVTNNAFLSNVRCYFGVQHCLSFNLNFPYVMVLW